MHPHCVLAHSIQNDIKKTQQLQQLTSVWVFGVYNSDGRSDRCVIKYGDLVVAGGEARWIIVHILDHQQDIRLARPPPAIRRLRHQVVLDLLLTVQHSQSEQLTWGKWKLKLRTHQNLLVYHYIVQRKEGLL